MTEHGLSSVALPHLQQLLRLVTTGELRSPLTETALLARGLGPVWRDVAWLAAFDAAAIEAVLRVAVVERTTRPVPRLELVWTGPEARVSTARDTAVVVRELFTRAQHSVLIAGYRVDAGKTIFEPLQAVMRERNVRARIYLHLDDRPGMSAEEAAAAGAHDFLRTSWPAGEPTPAIFYDPRTVTPGSKINLHAKCVVVDDRYALIGSANFTHNAHARSLEVGVLIEDATLAAELTRQWQGLVDSGIVKQAL